MKASVQLRLARAIATHPGTSCTHEFAVDKAGNPVDPDNDNACRWCAWGALAKVLGLSSPIRASEGRAGENLRKAARKVGRYVSSIHDAGDKDEIEHMWSVAIELAEAEEAQEASLPKSDPEPKATPLLKPTRADEIELGMRVVHPDNGMVYIVEEISKSGTLGILDLVLDHIGMGASTQLSVPVYDLLDVVVGETDPESKRIDRLPANQVRPRMYVMHEDQARLVKEVQLSNPHWVRLVFVPMYGDLARYWDVQVHELVDVVGETEPKPEPKADQDILAHMHTGEAIVPKAGLRQIRADEVKPGMLISGPKGITGTLRVTRTGPHELLMHAVNLYGEGDDVWVSNKHELCTVLEEAPEPRKILAKEVKPGMRIRGNGWAVPEITVLRVTEASLKGLLRLFYTEDSEKWCGGDYWCIEEEDEVELLEEAPEPRKILAGDVKPGMRVRWFYDTGNHEEMLVVKVEDSPAANEWVRLHESDGIYDYRVFGRDREMELISESNLEPEDAPQPKMLIAYLEEAWEKRDTHTLIMDGVVVRDAGQWGDGPVEVTVFDENPFPIYFREQDLIVVGDRALARDTDGDEHWFALRDGPYPDSDIRVTDVKVDGVPVKFRGAENTDDTPPFELFAGTSKALDELGKQLRARAMAEAAAADGSIVHDSTGQVVKPVPVTGNEIAGCNCCICEYYRNSQQAEHPTDGPDIEKDMLVAKLEALMLGLFEGAVEPDDDEDVIDVHVIVIAG